VVQVAGHRLPDQNQRGPSRVSRRVGLTPHSSRAPTAKHRAGATVQVCIFCSAGPAFSRWCRLSSNVRQRSGNRPGSSMQSWKQPAFKALVSSKQKTRKPCVPAALLRSQGQCIRPAAAARGGKQSGRAAQERLAAPGPRETTRRPRRSAWQSAHASKKTEGTYNARCGCPTQASQIAKAALPAAARPQSHASFARRCLTPHSSRGPTAKRQARATVQFIFCSAGLAFSCRSRLSSNVRQRSGDVFVHRCSHGNSRASKPCIHRVGSS
jgi:hypothetical protein